MSANGLLGRIGIELYADLAKFSGDMGRAEKEARKFSTDVTSHFDKIAGAIAGIGTALGIVQFGRMIDQVAAARAELDDLADSGLGAVEELSKLQQASRLSGANFQELTAGLGKMIKGLAGSELETSKAGEAFRRLGIETRDASGALRQPAVLFQELSVKLDGYADGADKAAYMQAILGRGGEKYLPLLKDMVEYGNLNAKVTAEQAAYADEYQKSQKRLSIATDGVVKKIAGEMIPAAAGFIDALAKTIKGTNDTGGAIDRLTKDGSLAEWGRMAAFALGSVIDVGQYLFRTFEVVGVGVSRAIQIVGGNFAALSQAFDAVKSGNFGEAFDIISNRVGEIGGEIKAFGEDAKAIFTGRTFTDTLADSLASQNEKIHAELGKTKKVLDSSGLGQAPEKTKKEIDEYGKAVEDAAKRIAAANAEMLDPLNKLTAAEKHLEQLRASDVWKKFTDRQKETLTAMLNQAAGYEHVIEGQKEWNKVVEDAQKLAEEFTQKQADQVKALNDKAAALKEEVAQYGQLESVQQRKILADYKEALAIAESSGATEDYITHLRNLIKAQQNYAEAVENKEGLEKSKNSFKSWFELLDGGFKASLNGAKSFGDYIKNGLKNALYELIARPFVIQIAASLTGSNAQVVQAALGNNGGIGSLFGGQQGGASNGLGGLGNIASSILGQGGMLSGMGGMLASGLNTLGLGGASQFMGGLTGSIVGPALPGSALAAGQGMAGMLSSLGPLAQFVALSMAASSLSGSIGGALGMTPRQRERARNWGYLGIIPGLLGGALSRPGGDKDGGSFIGDFSGLTGSLVAPNLQHRFFTPSGMDGSMQTLAQGTASSYAEYVRRLGGTAANVSFGFGADTDPRGTAQDRVSALAFVGGQGVYYNRDRDVGRGGANIVPELQLESQRALIAALQATEMPAAIKKLFEGVNAMTLTADAATKLLDTATEYADALDALRTTVGDLTAQLDGLSDDGSGIANLRRQIAALSEAVTTAQEAYESAMSGTDPTAQLAALQQLTAAVTNRYNQEMQMVRNIAAAIDQAREGAYQFTLAMAQRYNNVGRYTDTSAASMARVGQLRESIDSTTDPAARLGYVNQALTALDNWVTSSRETVTRDFNARMAAQQQELAAIQTAAATRKTALQNEIEAIKQQIGLMQSFQQLASQARAAITALSLSGSNPLSVFGRFGMAGENVQSLLATYRNATGQDRITAASNVMQALQSRMALAGEAYQRPSDEYQAAYNEVVTAYSEIADSAQSEADRLYKLQEEIDSKTAEILKIDEEIKRVIEKQVDYSGEMNAALEAINAQAYAQYQILDAIGQESYAQSERHNLELLNALTGGDSIPVYTARETRTIRETLQAILDRMDGGGSLGNRSADPGAGVDRTRILAGGGGPPIEGDDTGVRVQTPIIVQLPNGGALAEFVLETVVGNGGAIVRVLDHLR